MMVSWVYVTSLHQDGMTCHADSITSSGVSSGGQSPVNHTVYAATSFSLAELLLYDRFCKFSCDKCCSAQGNI